MKIEKLFYKSSRNLVLQSTLNSYSQIFFSLDKGFSVIMIAVSFFDFWAGLSGLLAVLISNSLAYLIGFNRQNISQGLYGFNSLLVGLGMGVFYEPSIAFFTILFVASLFTLLVTIMMEGVLGKYGLSYLSLPFLIALWVFVLATRSFTELEISQRGIYRLNEMYQLGGDELVKSYEWFGALNWPKAIVMYFKSLGAIFFQYDLFAGILLAIGLLLYSRIGFLLSVFGFACAYLFYQFIGANISELSYGYIGFNFILTAIAVGGFFMVASSYSFLWVILLTPVISVLITSTSALLSVYQLSVYSLPFNAVVLLFLYVIKFRHVSKEKPLEVMFQQYSPEKNLYYHKNSLRRYHHRYQISFNLPFWGEWTVSQGHEGDITHKGEWSQAWDFEVFDENNVSYRGSGSSARDYYCFGKPVLSPASGIVEEIINGLEDNEINEPDYTNNWGNTIIIKHDSNVYSKLCHLKKDSFKVKRGDRVCSGEVLAQCGNSGRSPVPHLHFQVQSTPYVGSKTVFYPLSDYITLSDKEINLIPAGVPKKGDRILGIETRESLRMAYNFVPGRQIRIEWTTEDGSTKEVNWEVCSDVYNLMYFYEKETSSKAWYRLEGNVFMFTNFEGRKNYPLYYFFTGNYKMSLGFRKDMMVRDEFPLTSFVSRIFRISQDFLAPFVIFLKSEYSVKHTQMKEGLSDQEFIFDSEARYLFGKKEFSSIRFRTHIQNNKIAAFEVLNKNNNLKFRFFHHE